MIDMFWFGPYSEMIRTDERPLLLLKDEATLTPCGHLRFIRFLNIDLRDSRNDTNFVNVHELLTDK